MLAATVCTGAACCHGMGLCHKGRRQQSQAEPKTCFKSQPGAGLTQGSLAAFLLSRVLLHKVQLIGFKSKKRQSFTKLTKMSI